MFNISVNDKKNIYRSKPVMNVDITKPLTYDYMPEGYPSKSIETTMLMEEQEVVFSERLGIMGAVSPVILDTKSGDKLTVAWDGVSYNVTVKTPEGAPSGAIAFGNLGLMNIGDTEDYPFVYNMFNSRAYWTTADTAASHTIKVMRQQTKYTPIDANYMPEGYPKKDGWSVEWDGNIDGKISAVGAPFYKFSDMVLSYEEFLSARWVNPDDPSQFMMVSETHPEQSQVTDTIVSFSFSSFSFIVVSEDNAEKDGIIFPTKGLYVDKAKDVFPFKLIKETITPMSTDFIPKNFNVVFSGINNTTPDSCNVTYDELRGWIENGTPVFAIHKFKADDGSVSSVRNIVNFEINTDSINVYYLSGSSQNYFEYNSDGTFSGGAPS